jgi:hypothetical protein
MACNNCKDNEQIPHHSKEELAFAFSERMVKRLWIALIICICFIFASNAAWLYCWMQYDYSSEETIYQQDGEGTNIIGDSNEVDNYGAESDNSEAQENP